LCDFNYAHGDPVRSLFMFANGKPLETAIGWLETAIANAYGVKASWVADNHELIKAVAADPGRIWRSGIKAKEPFQFAAAVMEYVAADIHGPEYRTHLPVWLDASSNGLQHLACMRRDVELASMVNLEASANRRNIAIRDVYAEVAAHVRSALRADDDARFWGAVSLDDLRTILKRPIMTLPYGVTKRGMLEQIRESCKELGINAPFSALVRLRDHVWRAIEEKLPGAMKAREYIQEVTVSKYFLDCGGYVQWITPSGFPVANRYRKGQLAPVLVAFPVPQGVIA